MRKTQLGYDEVVIGDVVRSPLGRPDPRGVVASIRPATLLAQTASALLERSLLEKSAVTKVVVAGGPAFGEIARDACALVGLPADVRPACIAPEGLIQTAAGVVGARDVVLVLASSGDVATQPHGPTRRQVDQAESVATRWNLEREELDAYAALSRERAREVAAMGEFGPETVPAVAWSEHACSVVTRDETVDSPDVVRRPVDGARLLHAGNVSAPAVGAAATVLVGHDRALALGIRPCARIVGMADAHDPSTAGWGAIRATEAVLGHAGMDLNDLDHYEVSETFSALPLAWSRALGADINRFNPRGGALALGTPGHAAGLRSLATALSALRATGGRFGIHVADDAGGAGSALLLDYLHRPCCSREVLGGRFCGGSHTPATPVSLATRR